jgi:hypothetical protein
MHRSRIRIRRYVSALAALFLAAAGLVIGASPAFAVAPTVTSISPGFGSWQGGVADTVTGTGFFCGGGTVNACVGPTTVNYGTFPGGGVVVNSDTSISVTSPSVGIANAGIALPVTVTNSAGTSTAVVNFVNGNCRFGDAFISSASTTFTATTGVDSTAAWTPNQWANDTVTVGGMMSSLNTTYTATTATDATANWSVNEWAGLTVTQGANSGTVSSNTANTLTVAAWAPAQPLAGTTFTVVGKTAQIVSNTATTLTLQGFTSSASTTFTTTSATDSTATWTPNQWAGFRVNDGTAFASVVSNTATVLTTTTWSALPANGTTFTMGNWSAATPAATNHFVIHQLPPSSITNVTPGSGGVSVGCTHLANATGSFLMALTSPVAGSVLPFSVASDESLILNNSPALPPSSSADINGNVATIVPVLAKSTGGNPPSSAVNGDGQCPPTPSQVQQGLLTCAVAVANISGTNFGAALLEYPGQPTAGAPTLNVSATGTANTYAVTGNGWWGAGGSTIPADHIRVGCSGNPCTGGTAALTSNVTVGSSSFWISCGSALCTDQTGLATISGTFTTGGQSGTIAIDQPDTPPPGCVAPPAFTCFPANGPTYTTTSSTSTTFTANSVTDAAGTFLANQFAGRTITDGGNSGTVLGNTATTITLTGNWTPATPANGTTFSIVSAPTVEATVSSVAPTASITSAAGTVPWSNLGVTDIPANAITNSANPPTASQFWQPTSASAAAGPIDFTVNLGASTTLSAVTTDWVRDFSAPGFTIQTSPDNVTYTDQVVVPAGGPKSRTDAFTGGSVPAQFLRLHITSFPATGTAWAALALIQLGWDNHGAVFPQGFAGCTTITTNCAPNTQTWNPTTFNTDLTPPVITGASPVGASGTTAYNYVATSLNAYGESLAGPVKSITTGNAALTGNCTAGPANLITIQTVPGATSYNLYGRTGGAANLIANILPPANGGTSVTFCDGNGPVATIPQIPPASGSVPQNAVANANNLAVSPGTLGMFWQPTVAAAAGASYEVDLGHAQNLASVTPVWFLGFEAPSAYHIDTSTDGHSWTTQFTTTTNTSKTATDELPAGGVTASYFRVILDAFPASGAGYAAVALSQVTWNGSTASVMATPPTSSAFPQAYYPATQPNSATANTTSTWQSGCVFVLHNPPCPIQRSPSNIFNGGSLGTTLGTSFWQPVGAAGNTGNLIVAADLGNPRSVSTIKSSWLGNTACSGGAGTCNGFNPINYTIWTSSNGSTWTGPTTISGFDTTGCGAGPCVATDTLTGAPVANVRYVLLWITSWNSSSTSFGPAAQSFTVG